MEFSSDIAILQSALQLANKRCSLKSHTKNSLKSNVDLASSAIDEVCSGIYHKTTAEVCRAKKLKLTAVLLYKLLIADVSVSPSVAKTVSTELETWQVILHGLPQFSWPYVFDVIKESGLWQQVFKLLLQLPSAFAVQLLQELLQYFLVSSDHADIKMMSVVLAYISLHWQSPIYCQHTDMQLTHWEDCDQVRPREVSNKDAGSDELAKELSLMHLPTVTNIKAEELSNLILTMLRAAELIKADITDKTSLALTKLSLLNLIVTLSCGKSWTLASVSLTTNLGNDGNKYHRCHSPLTIMMDLLLKDNSCDEDLLRIIISEIGSSDLPLQKQRMIFCVDDVLPRLDQFVKCFLRQYSKDLFDELQHLRIDMILSDRWTQIYQCLWPKLYEQLILNQSDLLQAAVQDSLLDHWSASLAKILNELKSNVSMIHERRVKEVLNWQNTEQKMSKSLVMLRYQISGAQDYLMWLLELRDCSIITQPRWLEGVELGISMLTSNPFLMLVAIKQLSWLREKNLAPSSASKLKNIILKSFSDCDLEAKNEILDQLAVLYSSHELEEIFVVDDSAASELRVTLNRLTSDTLTDSVTSIACIFIQTPYQVVRAVLQCVVQNRGQVSNLVQVFQHLPAIAHLLLNDDIVLIRALKDITDNDDDMPNGGRKNITSFCKQLLQPYQRADGKELQKPVLSPKQLLHGLVLPVLAPSADAEYKKNRKSLCFQLLRASVCVIGELLPKWRELVLEIKPVVILYIILRILDDFIVSGVRDPGTDGNNANSSPDVMLPSRADWLGCLVTLMETVEGHDELISDCDLIWLRRQLEDCHWTTKCYCYGLYSVKGCEKNNIEIPHKVSELVDLPLKWSALSDDGFLALFQFITISDATLNLAKSHLKKDIISSTESFLTKLAFSLAVMLTWSTDAEFCRVVKFLCYWLDCDRSMKNVISSSKETSTGVCCCLLIKLVLKLIISGLPENKAYNWTSLAVTLALAVKTVILDKVCEPTALMDLCQYSIILCKILSDWPDTESAHHILTLELDVIGQFDVGLQQYKKESSNEEASDINDIISILRRECNKIKAPELRQSLLKVLECTSL